MLITIPQRLDSLPIEMSFAFDFWGFAESKPKAEQEADYLEESILAFIDGGVGRIFCFLMGKNSTKQKKS